MNATKKLLDKYAEACYAQKDKDIADRLHIKHSTLANWKAGRAHPDADSIEKMAEAIGEPLGVWLAEIEAERARTPTNRMVWLRLAKTLATATAAIAIAALPYAAHVGSCLSIVSNYRMRQVKVRESRRTTQLAMA